MATRLSTPKEMMTCQKCGNTQEKDKAFFVSYSPLHGATGRVPICKSCLNEYDFYDKKEIIEVLRAIDKPFKEVIYESCITGKDRAMLGKYIRMLSLSHKMETFSDSDGIIQENKSMLQVKSQIEQKRSELEQLQGAINELNQEVENKKKKIEIDDELIKKWGKGYEPDEYEMFENKFKLIESSYPIKSTMHYESLKLYVLYACRAELAIKEGDADEANKWGKLAQQQATQAKITPQNLTSADLSQGLDNFSSLAIAVEKAVDIIPLIPTYIEKGQDKADMMILFYINYERKLKGLPECTHEEVYNFYNEMIQSYIENNPNDYSFLISKDEDDNRPLINRVYDWVFNVRIPEQKRKHPHDPFYQNLDKWTTLVSYLRWFPDAFYRLITPKEGGIKLGLDQCVLLRALARFKHVYDVQGRGSGKTFIEQLYTYHTMTFYPYCDISMSAQTLANASSLVKDKYTEIMKFYPLLKNECIEKECRFTENNTEVKWKSGAILTTLANAQSSKGKRRKRLLIEESAQVNDKLYEDVLEPIVNVPRITLGSLGIISPIELNGSIHFFTTSWYKNTSEYHRNIKFFDDMCDLKGTFILGASWELNALFGRGEPKSSVMRKKESLSPTMFALNYMSEWVGATDGALISIEKVMNIRNVTQAELEWDKKSEYIIGCDVARSGHKENNQSSIVVLKLIKNKNGKLVNVVCVNIKNYPATTNFSTLAQNLMKFKMRYNAKAVVLDANGLGIGLVDELMKEQFDPITNESLGCWNTINTDDEPEIPYAEECLYALKSQGQNHDIIVNFTRYIETGMLKLLEKRQDESLVVHDEVYLEKEVVPFVQTDMLLEEIANLKLIMSETNSKLSVERITNKVDKDRYSALAYALYYIKLFEENDYFIDTDDEAADYCLVN